MHFHPFVDPLLSLLLLAGATVGHLALLIRLHNWCYGVIRSHFFSHLVRFFLGLAAVGGPLALFGVYGFDLVSLLRVPATLDAVALVQAYLAVCLVTGLVLVPAVLLRYGLRRPPVALQSNHTETVDVAARLGYRPLGHGKFHLLAALPGNEVFQVDFRELTLRIPRLPPAWDGLSILHLTDLHLHGTPDRAFFDYVVDHCNAWGADLVALTGDVVDSKRHHRWVVPVLGRLRWNLAAFAILGNHDRRHEVPLIRRRLRRIGMSVLANTWEQIEVRGQPLVVIGHEGPWFQPLPDLKSCPTDVFRLCLSHTPDNLPWARAQGIDLMLSGHVHGGQVRLPLLGSLLVPSRYGRRYDGGTFHEPPTLLHVSRGLSGEHPLRYRCRPEVTKLILRPA